MALFGARGLRAEVVEGIDIETGVTLSGDRVTVGAGPGDTLVLGEADVAPGQLTFQRGKGGWEYFASDLGTTQVIGGPPRAGPVKPGMAFRLGASARIEIARADVPAEAPAAGAKSAKKEVPLAVAVPAMLAMVAVMAGAVWVTRAGDGPAGSGLLTEAWFTRAVALEPYLDDCLAAAEGTRATAVPTGAPDAAFQAWLAAPPETETAAGRRAELEDEIRSVLAQAHLLAAEGRPLAASAELRRMEYVIPLGERDCPILTATRRDLAVLEMRGN